MQLPNDITEKAKDALQSLWGDSATVRRTQLTDHIQEEVTVYRNIPCHLSLSSPSALQQTETVAEATNGFTLFVDPSIVIHAGDSLTVSHKGQVFRCRAGKPFYRNFSNVIPLEEVEIA